MRETIIAPLLSRYAREGVRVHLAIATNGDKGVREHAEIPAGTALAQARAAELDCACQALGIQPPILLGLPDGGMGQRQTRWPCGNPACRCRRRISRILRMDTLEKAIIPPGRSWSTSR